MFCGIKLCKQCKDKNKYCSIHDKLDETQLDNTHTIKQESSQSSKITNNAETNNKNTGQNNMCNYCNNESVTECGANYMKNDEVQECDERLCYHCQSRYKWCTKHFVWCTQYYSDCGNETEEVNYFKYQRDEMIKCHNCNKTPTTTCDYKLDGRNEGWKCCVKLCKQCKDEKQHCPMHDHPDETNPSGYSIITEDPQTTGQKARCSNEAINNTENKQDSQITITNEIGINEPRRLCNICNKPPTTKCNGIDTVNGVEFDCNKELCNSCIANYAGCNNHHHRHIAYSITRSSNENNEHKI